MTTNEMLAHIIEHAGYIAAAESDGVSFRCEGTKFWFETFDDDPNYVRLMTSFVAPDGVSFDHLVGTANEINKRKKAVKVSAIFNSTTDQSYVGFAIEAFSADATFWSATFERALDALRGASDAYFAALAPLVAG